MQNLIVETLRVWREAERVLQALPPIDPNHEIVRRLVIDLRAMYAELSEKAATADVVAAARTRLEEAKEHLRTLEPAT